MKGTLHKKESGWQVWYHAKEDLFYGNTGVRILPLIDSDYYEVNRPGQYNDGKEVEFEIVANEGEPLGRGEQPYKQYAKLVDKATRPVTEDDAWPDYPTRPEQLREQAWYDIMAESNSHDDSEILAYIIKNYNPPTKKQDNE